MAIVLLLVMFHGEYRRTNNKQTSESVRHSKSGKVDLNFTRISVSLKATYIGYHYLFPVYMHSSSICMNGQETLQVWGGGGGGGEDEESQVFTTSVSISDE